MWIPSAVLVLDNSIEILASIGPFGELATA